MCAGDKLAEGISPVIVANGVKSMTTRTKMSRLAQYYRLKQKHSLMKGENMSQVNNSSNVYTADWLAQSTAYTKIVFEMMHKLMARFCSSSSRYIPDLSKLKKYTTPTLLLLVTLLVILKQFPSEKYEDNKKWKILYVLSFATHFGAQMWMTFVSGIVLYFSIPRHVFGQVQEVLFPFYYLFNSIVSFIWVVSFINTQQTIPLHSNTFKQVIALTICLCIEVLIRLYVAKELVILKQRKTKIEAEAGTGQEIGHQVLGELANCPHYMGILKKFRYMHSYTSVATIITVICSLYHLNYVVDKLCL